MTSSAPLIAVHLDLKGVAFRPEYLPRLLADLAGQRVNAVLVEYEDAFPFRSVDLAPDPAARWSPAALRRFLAAARRRGIEVIPLQQCLGHLEYLFKWRRYRRFAAHPDYPATLDLGKPRGRELVLGMLREVLEAHPDSRWVHVGMDEARGLLLTARRLRREPLDLFLDHLGEVCALCERHGKTPLVWADMLDDHLSPSALRRLEAFKERVVLCPWDYHATADWIAVSRLGGARVSREWREHPEDLAGPPLGPNSRFVEDLPPFHRRLLAPYRRGRLVRALFHVDLWTRRGFRVMGASALRVSADGAVLPPYPRRAANLRLWGREVRRARQFGLLGTSWARGTSWCPPNLAVDLLWPLVGELSRAMGRRPPPFFRGLPAKTVDDLVMALGRSRDDWRLEGEVADRMEALAPRLKSHRHEWRSMVLMARALSLRRRAEFAALEVDDFRAAARPTEGEWVRRLREQAALLREIPALRGKIRAHFAKRHRGEAFEEWLAGLFDLHAARLKDCLPICREKLLLARRKYAH
jgi:hypothetical protein